VIKTLVIAPPLPEAPTLVADLETGGLVVCARQVRPELVRAAVQHAPDVVVIWEPCPVPELFDAVRLLAAAAPTPVLVFTSDVRAESMDAALAVGIDGWVVNGYAANRLRPLIQLTIARHRQMSQLRDELTELRQRYDERKLVDRAKGILMNARQVSEDEAFRLLRSASMHAKQRMGQVSQQVIDAAHYADAINRAGRLRMLSQRIVKLYALAAAGVEVAGSKALLADSSLQIEQIFALLGRNLSRPTFGDLLDTAMLTWSGMHKLLGVAAPSVAGLATVDQEAERLLEQADRLTQALESAGLAPSLHVINTSGRQRMLAQRLAKQALLGALLPEVVRVSDDTAQAFEQGLAYLREIPLSSVLIRDALAAADVAWAQMLTGARSPASKDGRLALAAASEELLALFDRLTGAYEHSMQLLMG
jgi:AmiR/NasT family two-component response regulator